MTSCPHYTASDPTADDGQIRFSESGAPLPATAGYPRYQTILTATARQHGALATIANLADYTQVGHNLITVTVTVSYGYYSPPADIRRYSRAVAATVAAAIISNLAAAPIRSAPQVPG